MVMAREVIHHSELVMAKPVLLDLVVGVEEDKEEEQSHIKRSGKNTTNISLT